MKNLLVLPILLFTVLLPSSTFCQIVNYNDLPVSKVESSVFVIDSLPNEVFPGHFRTDCIEPYEKLFGKFGKWLTFRIYEDGNLAFDIIPHDLSNDIDFLLFRNSSSGILEDPIRCMLAGPEILNSYWDESGCLGITGMRDLNSMDFLGSGCIDNNNYLNELPTEKGDEYLLYVNNFNSHAGFTIVFDDSAIISENPGYSRSDFDLKLKPNPTSGLFRANYKTPVENSSVEIMITGRSGNLITRLKKDDLKSGWNYLDFDITDLVSGFYVLTISYESHQISKPFIKQ